MRPLNGLHVEVESAGFGVGADGGVAGVGEGAGLAVAEAGDIVLVAAEVLLFGGSGRLLRLGWGNFGVGGEWDILELEGAELLIYDLPYDFV